MPNRTTVTWLTGKIPPALVDLLRADVLDSVAEMVQEIQAHVPEYAPPDDDKFARGLRRGVEMALRRYVELLDQHVGHTGPAAVRDGDGIDWRVVYHAAGANEMREGRSLDALHAAIRLCARVANRRLRTFAERHAMPPNAVAWLAEAIFDNVDDVARAATDGYAQAQEAEAGELDRRRRRLLDLFIADPPPSASALANAAAAAGWRLPRRLAAVAVAGPIAQPPVMSPEILAAFDHTRPCLIVPDPKGLAQVRALENGLSSYHAAVGPAVSPVDAGKSLRWARLALDLSAKGLIPHQPIIWCGDHLAALAVFQDQALLATLTERRLAPLAHLREDKRELLADTLLAWLKFNMNANEVAAHLHVHPQTVRHRLRQLAQLFGNQIRDPDLRFELEIALRAERARNIRRARTAAS
ncbi:PucR family transcriptional regulator [Phytohabitans rumicis]|nr:helix-turn-helix domain-containing protein [Phytohabitans rumicis]